MNFTFRNPCVRNKSTKVIDEIIKTERKRYDIKILGLSKKGDTSCRNDDITSKMMKKEHYKLHAIAPVEFKFIRKNQNWTADESPPVLRSIKRAKKKNEGNISVIRVTSPNTSAKDYVLQQNKNNVENVSYGLIKRSFSTFLSRYNSSSRCESFMFKESEDSTNVLPKMGLKVIKQKPKVIKSNQSNQDCSNRIRKNVKIIKYKNDKSNVQAPKLKTTSLRKMPSYGKTVVPEQIIDHNVNKVSDNRLQLNNHRENEINLQMLPSSLFKQVFSEVSQSTISPEKLSSIKEELKSFDLNINSQNSLPDVDIGLPSLEGKDIEEHFYNIGNAQAKPYLKVVKELIENIPPVPKKWILQEGWTRYSEAGAEKVDYPVEDGLIFDVEVCVKEGPLPTLATAVSKNAWYGWVSKSLVEGVSVVVKDSLLSMAFLIPLESTPEDHGRKLNSFQKRPKALVGHNVSYDRARIKEQYWLNSTGTRFIDTMSMHVSVSGITSFQRALLKADKEDMEENLRNYSSLNNLADVHKLYCGQKIDKKARDLFVDGTLLEIREQFDDMMKYCASDVQATFNVLQSLFPMFQERFPHPVTFAGMLELGSVYLPVNSNWQRYIEESESTFEDLSYESKLILSKRADEVCKLFHNDKYKEDLWMWDQDWSTQQIKMKTTLTKAQREEMNRKKAEEKERIEKDRLLKGEEEEEKDPLAEKFAYLHDTKYFLPARMPFMPGYPKWYRNLCLKRTDENWAPGAQNISTSMKIVPKLLNLTWENYPLHYIKEHGWGFLVPYSNDLSIETKIPLKQLLEQCPLPIESNTEGNVDYAMSTLYSDVQDDLNKTEFWRNKKKKNLPEKTFYKGSGVWCNVDIDNCCWFFKLPHKDGSSKNVGNPLAKDFLSKFSDNILAGLDVSATSVLKIARMLSYWRNNRDRILSQLVIWFDEESLPSALKKDKRRMRYGAIVPQVIVSGTLTRRAVEPTWMTASNAHLERIGSELRAMIQAPPGYNIVGADVDSQELWIASAIGDAHYAKIHGATPFGWMTLIGNKANGTDMHSVTAKAVGISRDHAKVINYARIYGAGEKFAERLLKQFNPTMTEVEASSKSKKMFAMTKGRKVFRLKKKFVCNELQDKEYSTGLMFKIAKMYGRTATEMFEKGQWIGGSESAMFNRLEEIAGSPQPVTPFLNSRLSRALEAGQVDDNKYLPTKVNWVVQSGAVDFLHLMLVSMRWLMRDNARFCLSFHDEIRYLVSSKHKYNAALAMHITNLLTRSFCSSRLGIKDLPMSVAFFTSVEVDTVLRKEASVDCKTPSNPHGLEAGYDIPPGESLDVWKAIEKSGGSLGSWHNKNKINSSLDPNLTSREDTKDETEM